MPSRWRPRAELPAGSAVGMTVWPVCLEPPSPFTAIQKGRQCGKEELPQNPGCCEPTDSPGVTCAAARPAGSLDPLLQLPASCLSDSTCPTEAIPNPASIINIENNFVQICVVLL